MLPRCYNFRSIDHACRWIRLTDSSFKQDIIRNIQIKFCIIRHRSNKGEEVNKDEWKIVPYKN